MKLNYIFILLLLPHFMAAQQSFDAFLNSVETNNKSIASAKKLEDVEVLEANTGIYLSNPEISYDYLGSGSEYYSEMVVSQSFDFPSTYFHKNKIADITELQASNKYRQLKIELYSEAAEVYTQQIIVNRKLALFYDMETMLKKLQSNAEKKLEVGEINILELNRIRSEVARNMVELNMLANENQGLILKVAELNGGKSYEINDTEFLPLWVPSHTDTLIQEILTNHPLNSYWKNEIEKAGREIQLQKSSGLPKFELGYRQDLTANQTFRGIHAGLSIPILENKNTIRFAKARQLYVQEEFATEQLAFRNHIWKMIIEYEMAWKLLTQLEQMIETLNTPELLMKSYQSGQINYTEFFSEFSNYQETQLLVEDLRQKAVLLHLRLYVLMNY